MRRVSLILGLTLATMLSVATAAAQALVVADAGVSAGVALVPGTQGTLPAAVKTPTPSGKCGDPWLAADLGGPVVPTDGLCWNGGQVMHSNETFALTWDPGRRYWATTRDYVEQFLRDVASASGSLGSPYALTTQYHDGGGQAASSSYYGGGCVDFGPLGGSCRFASSTTTGPGTGYPASNTCPVSGLNFFHEQSNGSFDTVPNDICLTDVDVRHELASMIQQMGLADQTRTGATPLLVVLLPAGVEVCLDGSGTLCSANGSASAQLCSYHSYITLPGGQRWPYVVQPWTALTACDEPGLPAIPAAPTAGQLAQAVGARLVSPLSQGQIATIVDPLLNGWYGQGGGEMSDNGCVPLGPTFDTVSVGGTNYVLQREFNNAGVLENDPNAPSCAPLVMLSPTFVVPSPINAGDLVALDGSTTVSTLMVPNGSYKWNFGDGTTAVGHSVEHAFDKGGTYTVTLTVTDRGGNTASVSERVVALGPNGQPPQTPVTPPTLGLRVHLQLLPQGLHAMLRHGLAVLVSSNQAADGFAALTISRRAARAAHIRAGRGSSVMIARGTVAGIKDGTIKLHLRLSRSVAAKLAELRHVTVTVRLALVTVGHGHMAIDAAGRY